jgi:hypothetical protein
MIKQDYDYSKSSEENYASVDSDFVGEYKKQREQLDYTYHTRYSEERQYLQVEDTNTKASINF